MSYDLRNFIKEGDTVRLGISECFNHNEQNGKWIGYTRKVRKYVVTKVYPYFCVCFDYIKGTTRCANVGDLVMTHSIDIPGNILTNINLKEE